MQSKKRTSGFCFSCQKNVPHRRWINSPLLLILDLLTLRLAKLVRLGPWYCVHCDDRKSFLPLRKKSAMDYRSSALVNETQPSKFVSRANTPEAQPAAPASPASTSPAASPSIPVSPPTPAPSQPALEPAESVGNFIKTDSSLLMKSNRLQRYSEKYRDAVVRRILSGASSIKQVRDEKQLSESEVTDWIADLFERQQQKIDSLQLFKKSISQSELLREEVIQELADSQSVAGQVRPR